MGLKETLRTNADTLFGDTSVIFAYLFGSYAVGQSHPFSDLDIAIYLGTPLNINESKNLEMDLALKIDSIFSDGPTSDVRIMNHLPLTVAGQIISEGILIYSIDEDVRIEYETFIRCLYFDFMPFIQQYQREYLSHIEND